LSRVPSETSGPAKELWRSARSPAPSKGTQRTRSKTPKRRVQNVVLDSEDEDLDSFDGFDLDVMPKAASEMDVPTHVDPIGRSSQIELPNRPPSKLREVISRPQLNHDDLVTPDATQSPKKARPSPTKARPTPASTLQSTSIPPVPSCPKTRRLVYDKQLRCFWTPKGAA